MTRYSYSGIFLFCIALMGHAFAQNLELTEDSGWLQSSCFNDCYLEFVPFSGGTSIYLMKDIAAKGTTWVNIDIPAGVQGDLNPPANPPAGNETVIRQHREPGFNNGSYGDWEFTAFYIYSSGIMTDAEFKKEWRPACPDGMQCDGDSGGGFDGEDDDG